MTDSGANKIKVVVVDDDDLVRDTLQAILIKGGFEVQLASGGEDLDRQLEAFSPDVLITDIFMPRVDGIEVIRDVRKQFPDIKIVAMSGMGHVENAQGKPMMLEMAKDLGADASIQKPFRPDDITRVLAEVVSA